MRKKNPKFKVGKMKRKILLAGLFASMTLVPLGFSDSSSQTAQTQPAQGSQPAANPNGGYVENIENVVPNAVNVNDNQLMQSLGSDPMLQGRQDTQQPNTGTLSGEKESTLVNAGDANFDNISTQVDKDIKSANSEISSGNADGIKEASQISQEMGINDVNNLSVPNDEANVPPGTPNAGQQ